MLNEGRGVDLAVETVVGLPRSNLVKKPAIPAPASAPPAPTANPFEATVPHGLSPFELAPTAVAAPMDPFRTQVDEIEVDLDQTSRDAPVVASTAPMAPPLNAPTNQHTGSTTIEPSTTALLERAARLGPRMTWESIVLPSDPVLIEKSEPRVAERRARLRKVVTVALGGCLALCIAAIGASLISGGDSTGAASAVARTAPATAFVPVEKLDITKHGRAHVHPTAALAAPKATLKRH